MRVVLVGGAGAMGAHALRTLATFDEFDELVIADRDVDAAQRLVGEVGPRVSVARFDADTDDPHDLFAGAWGVLNTLGPFTRFGTKALGAAIEAGCHYVDIDDDWEPTLEALDLHDRAEAKGVTALIGMGQSPGISNVLAVHAATQLDDVHELITAWNLFGTRSAEVGKRPNAAMVHFIHQTTGTIRVLDGGTWQDVRPMQELTLAYPGHGDVPVRTIGHPEAVTLPRRFPGLRRCINVMDGPSWYFDQMAEHTARVDRGEVSVVDAAVMMEDQPPVRPAAARSSVRTPILWSWAKGLRDGVETVAVVGLNRWPAGGMAGSTGTPAAVALRMVARGDVTKRGVVTPEDAVDPKTFFARLDPLCTLGVGTDLVDLRLAPASDRS